MIYGFILFLMINDNRGEEREEGEEVSKKENINYNKEISLKFMTTKRIAKTPKK